MTAARRWWCVSIGVALLLAVPFAVRALPAHDADVSALALLHRVQRSAALPFSGYAESAGALVLPDDHDLSSLSGLLGAGSRIRVWWAGPEHWRTANLRATGETDLMRDGALTTRWVYESRAVTLSSQLPVRLPTTYDVLPNVLARTVLADARPGEVVRLPAQRVAGRDALGLRLVPDQPQASIGHVDVYADSATGLPLRVSLFARGARLPAFTTSYLSVSMVAPARADIRFTTPVDGQVRYDDIVDVASAADLFGDRVPPGRLAGLPSRPVRGPGSVGVYGRGPTYLVALPLWPGCPDELCTQLAKLPGHRKVPAGLLVATGPLHLLVASPEPDGGAWLLAGTVTPAALMRAAHQLASHSPGRR